MKLPNHLKLKKSYSIYEADLNAIFIKDWIVMGKPKIKNKTLTKKEKLRIITWMCGPKMASDFEFYGIALLPDKKHKTIMEAFKKLCDYNKVIPADNTFADYCRALASKPNKDYVIPAQFVK